MAEDLLERIVRNNYEDYGSIHVRAVEQPDEDLVIYLAVELDEDPDLPRDLRVTCRSVTDTNLTPGHYLIMGPSHDHVLLWHYHQPHIIASFYGRVDEPMSVACALYERHLKLVGNWIPTTKYLGGAPSLSDLIAGGFGMLAEGPERLLLAYEEVLAKYGVPVSHHPHKPPPNEKLSALFFDESYVIAEHFSVKAI